MGKNNSFVYLRKILIMPKMGCSCVIFGPKIRTLELMFLNLYLTSDIRKLVKLTLEFLMKFLVILKIE